MIYLLIIVLFFIFYLTHKQIICKKLEEEQYSLVLFFILLLFATVIFILDQEFNVGDFLQSPTNKTTAIWDLEEDNDSSNSTFTKCEGPSAAVQKTLELIEEDSEVLIGNLDIIKHSVSPGYQYTSKGSVNNLEFIGFNTYENSKTRYLKKNDYLVPENSVVVETLWKSTSESISPYKTFRAVWGIARFNKNLEGDILGNDDLDCIIKKKIEKGSFKLQRYIPGSWLVNENEKNIINEEPTSTKKLTGWDTFIPPSPSGQLGIVVHEGSSNNNQNK